MDAPTRLLSEQLRRIEKRLIEITWLLLLILLANLMRVIR